MGLKIIGTIGCQFRFCLDESIPVFNEKTGLYDQANKRIFTGPLVQLKPVYPIGSRTAKYYTAEVELDDPNSHLPEYVNLRTGKPLTYADAILSLTKSAKHMLAEGQIAVAVTPDTVDAVKEALSKGFPANRVNDALGLLNPANKVPEPVVQEPIDLDSISFDSSEIKGIDDLKRMEDPKVEVELTNEQLLEEGVKKGLITRNKGWFDFGSVKLGPGKEKALEKLENAPELIAILKGEVKPNPNAVDNTGA